MDAIDLIRFQIRQTWAWLEMTVSDVTEEQANWLPAGLANSIGTTYAHTIFSADEDFNQMLAGGEMMLFTSWAERCGLSELPPKGEWDWSAWARRVRIDWPALRAYADAVRGVIDGLLERLTYEELKRDVDMSQFGLGVWKGLDIYNLHVHHPRIHGGEIACLKGLLGAKAWPKVWQPSVERPAM